MGKYPKCSIIRDWFQEEEKSMQCNCTATKHDITDGLPTRTGTRCSAHQTSVYDRVHATVHGCCTTHFVCWCATKVLKVGEIQAQVLPGKILLQRHVFLIRKRNLRNLKATIWSRD